MWVNAQRDGHPLKLQGCPKLAKRSQPLVGQSSPYYQDIRGVIAV